MRIALRGGVRDAMLIALLFGVGAAPVHAAPADKKKPVAAAPAAPAAPAGGKPAQPAANVPLLPGAGSKEPVNIDADKLDYYDKEQKLIYTGNVVAVQGDSTLKSSVLTIFLEKQAANGTPGATAPAPPEAAPGAPSQSSSVKHMEADGPVTLISKDQIGTGDHATYDKAENKVYLNGNVTLSQGTNVTQGDRLVYDMTSGQAQVFSGSTNERVKSVFTPGSGTPDGAKPAEAKAAPKKEKPGAAKHKTSPGGGKAARDATAQQ